MRLWLIAILCVAALCVSGAAGAADRVREFTADVTTVDDDKTSTGKVIIAPEMMRMELADTIVITRLDQNKSWIFIPRERAYIEQSIDRKFITSASEKLQNETGRELIGAETVGGRDADKYKVTYKDATGTAVVFQWIATDVGVPVKTASADGSWSVAYTNIRAAPVDRALFEIPQGYVETEAPYVPVVSDMAEMNDD